MPFLLLIPFLWIDAAFAMPTLKCPALEGAASSVELDVDPGEYSDQVTLGLREADATERNYRTITRAGAVARQLRRGRLQIVLRQKESRATSTVTSEAALLVLERGFDGRFGGRLAAGGLVFEILCQPDTP